MRRARSWCAGPQVSAGYWDDPEATAAGIVDGWLHTGDIGTLDADGLLTVVDRAKDLVVTGGENVSSLEVESAVGTHPLVASVAVVGLPDDRWGEAVTAVVVPRPGLDAEQVAALPTMSRPTRPDSSPGTRSRSGWWWSTRSRSTPAARSTSGPSATCSPPDLPRLGTDMCARRTNRPQKSWGSSGCGGQPRSVRVAEPEARTFADRACQGVGSWRSQRSRKATTVASSSTPGRPWNCVVWVAPG